MTDSQSPKLAEAFRLGGVSARILAEEGGTLNYHTVIVETASGDLLAQVDESDLQDVANAAKAADILIDWLHGSMDVATLTTRLKALPIEPWQRDTEPSVITAGIPSQEQPV